MLFISSLLPVRGWLETESPPDFFISAIDKSLKIRYKGLRRGRRMISILKIYIYREKENMGKWTARSLPTSELGLSLSSPVLKDTPQSRLEITGIIGVKEKIFKIPLYGIITKKGRFMDTQQKVKIIGEYGVFYSYNDGIDRVSENGKHFIVVQEGSKTIKKVLASKITIPHDH